MTGRLHDDLSLLVYDMTNKWNSLKAKIEKEAHSTSASTLALVSDFEAPFNVVVEHIKKMIEINHVSKGKDVPPINHMVLDRVGMNTPLKLVQELKGMLASENFLGDEGMRYDRMHRLSKVYDDEALMNALKLNRSARNCHVASEFRRHAKAKQIKMFESWELLLDANFIAHKDSIWAMAIAGSFLFSGAHDGTIKKWCTKTNACLKEIKAHNDAVLALLSLGEVVVSGSADCKICIFSTDTLTLLESHDKHSQRVGALEVVGRKFATGSADDSICIWKQISDGKQSWTCDKTLRGHTDSVLVLKHSNDHLYSGSCDQSLCVWSTKDWSLVQRFDGHKGSILGITTLSRYAVSCSENGCIEVRNLTCWSSGQSGNFIITTGEDHAMRMWKIEKSDIKCVGTRILPGPVSSMISDGIAMSGCKSCEVFLQGILVYLFHHTLVR
eukprot:746491-Hanusia_phi.AAC.6